MTNPELVDVIAKNLSMTKKSVVYAIDEVFEQTKTVLANVDKCVISSFEKFEVLERAVREERNSSTDENMHSLANQNHRLSRWFLFWSKNTMRSFSTLAWFVLVLTSLTPNSKASIINAITEHPTLQLPLEELTPYDKPESSVPKIKASLSVQVSPSS